MEERLTTLLGVFSKKYRELSLASLAERAGVSVGQLRPGYPRRPEVIVRIALAAGDEMAEGGLIGRGQALSIREWVEHGDRPDVEDLIGRCVSGFRCMDCREFVDGSTFMRPHSRCFPCYNAHQATPATKAWLSAVDKLIGKAPKHLLAAWQTARQGPKAVSYKRLAELTNQSEAELQAAWMAAGLPLRPAGRPRKTTPNMSRQSVV